MKIKILIPLFLIHLAFCKAQGPVAEMFHLTSPVNSTVLMPVVVHNLNNVYAVSLGVLCGPGAVIDSIVSLNPLFPTGFQGYTVHSGELLFAWFYLNPVSFSADTLFFISISYTSGLVPVIFDWRQCEMGDQSGQAIPTVFTNGSINSSSGFTYDSGETYFRTFPNPVQANQWLNVETGCKGAVEYSLLNMQGMCVMHGLAYAESDKAGVIRVKAGALPSGLYMLYLRGGQRVMASKVLRID
ncbi:MAG TPA: T9SS type A sorting domain-containing protein [Bacteroidales bacterium]|nr:T9SS type A sorting domain-containing protein [Bacteroidales bacterium]HSA44863.1 T9SS type A sorting domain-containing protein [Bacteroidales bacterium]